MMNKILVRNGIVDNINNDNYKISDNKIIFKNSGIYYLEYVNDMVSNLTLVVDNDIQVVLVEISFDNNLEVNNHYIVKKGNLKVNKFYCNKSVDEHIKIDLISELAQIDYDFASICIMEEKYVFDINHQSKKTVSNIRNKAIALNNSKLNYVINSNVDKEMEGSLLDQTTRVITFGECDVQVMPNMFIDLDNVVSKHGSVIGTIKEELIFYLMSRGIEYNDAVKLIIKGYLLTNSNFDYDLRGKIIKKIDMYWR